MKVRQATMEDAQHCAELGLKFITAAKMPPATLTECLDFCQKLIASPSAGVFVSEKGVIAGVLAPLYYKPSHLQAVEAFWWSEDGTGRLLLTAFETWAVANGADDINMSTLVDFTPPGIAHLLERRGYVAKDQTYRRVIK